MKIITISKKELKNLAHKLLSMIRNDQFDTDIIIGIATGGIYVSKPIHEELIQDNWQGKYHEIKLSRPSTERKEKLQIKVLLRKLPYFILNPLRKLEVFIFEHFKSKEYLSSKENKVIFSETQISDIRDADSILLVDDAIDTGSTILAIRNVIKSINPKVEIKVAVLTVTHKKPYIEPDYTLYRRVLLRCPWALDYKGCDKIG